MKPIRIGLGIAVVWLLSGCASDLHYNWDLSVVLPLNPEGTGRFYYLIGGFWLTLQVSLLSTCFGVIFGLLIAFLGMSRLTIKLLGVDVKVYLVFQFCIRIYLEVIRNMPVFVLLLWAYFAMPIITPFEIQPFEAVIFTLSITAAAFLRRSSGPASNPSTGATSKQPAHSACRAGKPCGASFCHRPFAGCCRQSPASLSSL